MASGKKSKTDRGAEFFNALLIDFEKHGASAIERVRAENPLAYLQLIAALVSKDIRITFNASNVAGEMH